MLTRQHANLFLQLDASERKATTQKNMTKKTDTGKRPFAVMHVVSYVKWRLPGLGFVPLPLPVAMAPAERLDGELG